MYFSRNEKEFVILPFDNMLYYKCAMKYHSKGNDLIRYSVIALDFVLINLVFLYFYKFTDLVPVFFRAESSFTILAINFAMFIAQYLYGNMIYFRRQVVRAIIVRVLKLAFAQAFTMFLLLRLISDGGGYFKFMFIFSAAEFITLWASRMIEVIIVKYLRQIGRNQRYVIFVGHDPANLIIYNDMEADPTTGYQVLGYYSEEPIDNCPPKLKRLGDIETLNRHMEEGDKKLADVDELYCSMSHSKSDQIIKIMRFCDEHIIHFRYVPRQFGNFRLNLKPEQYGEMTIFTNHKEPLARLGNRIIKRTFDILFSLAVCICLLPFLPIVALIIKRQSPGPLFFVQERTGINGKTFKCYKFRSMHMNNEADTLQATKEDPRKFAFGNFMRKTNLDELPQFFNVLKGDMSVVGPRPHMLHHTEIYGKLIDKYMVRHFCKPGITGWAQVTGFRGETKEQWQMEGRIERDIWYIENWSFLLDIEIILRTVGSTLIPDKKAY